jgi:RimJ/RimL family protein N-acetyltransferase
MVDFIPIDETGLKEYESWFGDSELRRRIEHPTTAWFRYVRNQPGVHAWMIHETEIPVGHIQLDVSADQAGSFSIVVKTQLRNRGYGRRILRAFLARPEVLSRERLEADVEHDNIPAQRCLRAAGLTQEGVNPDREGFLAFVYEPKHKT